MLWTSDDNLQPALGHHGRLVLPNQIQQATDRYSYRIAREWVGIDRNN